MAEKTERPSGAERTDLADLLRARRAELRLSFARLEERCVDPDTGERVKSSWLHRLERGEPVIAPDLPKLRALAAGLEVPLGRIQDAAGSQFFGIDAVWSSSGEARALVERAERMTPEQRDQLMRLIETFAPRASGA